MTDSNFNKGGSEAPNSVERQAADWFARRYRGLTSEHNAEFEHWLRADPSHAEVFAEMEETWRLLGHLPRSTMLTTGPKRTGMVAWVSVALAAAAVLAVGFVLWRTNLNKGRDYSAAVATEIGVLRRLELPDRSVLRLSADSAVDIGFTGKERRIVLQRGEADFSVAKNSAWPFIVRAESVEIRAVGTAFDVRLRPGAIDLLVIQGKVQVYDTTSKGSLLETAVDSEPCLLAGQHVHIALRASRAAAPAKPETFSAEMIESSLAWEHRRLVFHRARLADIAAEFNRFNRRQLVVGSPELAEQTFGGTYPADDCEGLVTLLERHYGIVGERSSDKTVLMVARQAAGEVSLLPARQMAPPASSAMSLVFKSDRLADIVEAFNRHNGHKLVLRDPALADRRFGGTFPAGDYEAFVKLLEANFGILVVRHGNETLLGSVSRGVDTGKNP